MSVLEREQPVQISKHWLQRANQHRRYRKLEALADRALRRDDARLTEYQKPEVKTPPKKLTTVSVLLKRRTNQIEVFKTANPNTPKRPYYTFYWQGRDGMTVFSLNQQPYVLGVRGYAEEARRYTEKALIKTLKKLV